MFNTDITHHIVVSEQERYRVGKLFLILTSITLAVLVLYISRPATIDTIPVPVTDSAPLKFSQRAQWDDATLGLIITASHFGEYSEFRTLQNLQITPPTNMADQIEALKRLPRSSSTSSSLAEAFHQSVDAIILPHLDLRLGQLSATGKFGSNWILFNHALQELDAIITAYKRETDTALPVHYDPSLQPQISGPTEPGLPSRSVARAQLVALLATMIETGDSTVSAPQPAYAANVTVVREHNLAARFEFPIDGSSGIAVANAYVADIATQPVFTSLLYHARTEWWEQQSIVTPEE